jgi:hypothetical protein
MSTLQKVNFTPVSDILPVHRRDFPLADKTLANPQNAVAIVDGEWLIVNAAGKSLRASDVTTPGAVALQGAKPVRSFPCFAERGRSDVQAMSDVKMPILFLGQYEFDTRIFDAAVAVSGGAAITYVGQPLKVATITMSGRNFTGLVGADDIGAADTDPVVGYVTRLPANNGGQLRFMSGWKS